MNPSPPGNANTPAIGIIRHVVCDGCPWEAGHAALHVEHHPPCRSAGGTEQSGKRLIERERDVCSRSAPSIFHGVSQRMTAVWLREAKFTKVRASFASASGHLLHPHASVTQPATARTRPSGSVLLQPRQ